MADFAEPLKTPLPKPAPMRRWGVSPALVLALVVVSALVGGTLALWAHLGPAVFYEMIAAGIAYCL